MRSLARNRVGFADSGTRLLLALSFALAATALVAPGARAGLRSRELSSSFSFVEPTLESRASRLEALGISRLHAIVEVTPANRARAEEGGVRLLHSIDGDLWLASLPGSATSRGLVPSGVVRAWDLRPEDRHDVQLLSVARRSFDGRVLLRVKTFADVDLAEVRARLTAAGAVIRRESTLFTRFEIAAFEEDLDAILDIDAVRWVEASPGAPEDANNGMRFDAEVNAPQGLGYGGAGVVLGMWDSGMPDPAHPDLSGRVVAGQSGLALTLHPSHVAGIAIGNGANSAAQGGSALQWRGVASESHLVAYDAIDAIDEFDDAISAHDIDLSTNSWVYPVTPSNCFAFGDYGQDAPEFDALVRGLAGKPLPIVFAAGNERDDGDCGLDTTGGYRSLPPPATAKNVISVGAHYSDLLHMTPFSSWGPTDDGRMKPDMTAPGCQSSVDFGVTSTSPGGTYTPVCGTSQAAPVVSGSIAILLEEWRARFSPDPAPSTFKALLGGFAKDRAGSGPDYRFGLGAIRLDRSLKELRSATTIEDEVAHGATDAWAFLVPAGTDTLVVTLAWDDPPGAELADTTLVNDLDLILESPSASLQSPFVLDPSDPFALATTGVNRLDNVEQVRVIAPAPGAWTARVAGTLVPDGPQMYSLVGFDTSPPADPASFATTTASDTSIAAQWIRAGDPDRAGTLVVRGTSPIAWAPENGASYVPGAEPSTGVFVVASDDVDHESTPIIDSSLDPGTTYFYAAFSFDEVPNYAPGVGSSATTSSNAVGAPIAPNAPAIRPSLTLDGSNPCVGTARLRFELGRTTRLALSIYDARGARVATLRRGVLDAGTHRATWNTRSDDGGAAPAGIFFARLETDEGIFVTKLLLLR